MGTAYYWVVRVLLLVIGFTMSISLMNIFIAVLTVSYTNLNMNAKALYSRFQAGAIVEAQAVSTGWAALTRCMGRSKDATSDIDEDNAEKSSKMTDTSTGSGTASYSRLFGK